MKALDTYGVLPSGMRNYISNYGFHFSKKACDFAISLMKGKNGEAIGKISKEQVDEMLKRYGVELENKYGYDYVFAFHMGKADYLNSSVPDEQRLMMFVKDTVDDPDASEETTFRRWLATMVGNGEPIIWDDLM